MSQLIHRLSAFAVLFVAIMTSGQAYAQSPSTKRLGTEQELDGVLKPIQDVDVATTEIGIVQAMFVKAGDRVTIGQPIAMLDTDNLQAQLRVKEAEAGARGKLSQASAELQLQQMKYDRLASMLQDGKANRLEVERAEADLIIAKGRLAYEQDQVNILQLDLQRVSKLLDERTVLAPCEGIVVEVFKQVGEYVASNSPNLVRIVDVRKLKATFALPEDELVGVSVGMPMNLEISGTKIKGIVDFVPPVADPATSWFMITVTIDNADEKIIGSRCQRAR